MNFDPKNFFIGLMDFFSILLPGALLTYLLMDEAGSVVLGSRYARLSGSSALAAFLVASYLLGHLIFLLGSWLDEIYDWARRYTLNAQIALLARRGRLLPWAARALIWLVFKTERNLAVGCAVKIKRQTLGPFQAADAINTFQWCKALLSLESQDSLERVQRLEADSKFFRSFAVLLALLLVTWPVHQRWPLAGILVALALLLLALWRYAEQRYKATNQAYWSVITLTARAGNATLRQSASKSAGPSRAGGVVYRQRRNIIEYLLVEATNDPEQWVLPKGHVEDGEGHRETAVREVREETGVWARIILKLRDVSWSAGDTVVSTRFFLMQAVGRGLRQDKDRQHAWLPLQDAIARADHPETRALLQDAEHYRIRSATTSTTAHSAPPV